MLGCVSVSAYHWSLDGINICQMTIYAVWQLSCVHFLHPTISEKNKIQINIWRNTFYKERIHVYRCGFLTSIILIDEVNNYTGVILRIACFDLNCPLFTCLDFWHRLSSIIYSRFRIGTILSIRKHGYEFITTLSYRVWWVLVILLCLVDD